MTALELSANPEQETAHEVMRLMTIGDELVLQSKLESGWEHIYRVVFLRSLDRSMHRQPSLVWVNRRRGSTVSLVVQACQYADAVQMLQRGNAFCRAGRKRQQADSRPRRPGRESRVEPGAGRHHRPAAAAI